MTGSDEQPRWRAMEIGPGGVPAERVTVTNPAGPPAPTVTNLGTVPTREPGSPAPSDFTGPSAVFGSFDLDDRRPSRRAGWAWISLAVVVAILVAAMLWSGNSSPDTGSGNLQPGDCLSSSGGQAVVPLDCSASAAEFQITARFGDSTNSGRCSAVSSDVVLVTRDDAVLCLNYLATVGDCLYAGSASAVGKTACRTPGSSTTPTGLFRVIAVLSSTVDARRCPAGTLESLVHVSDNQVLCLGLP